MYSDKEIDNLIFLWRSGDGLDKEIHEYLGWTEDEYKHWSVTMMKPEEY